MGKNKPTRNVDCERKSRSKIKSVAAGLFFSIPGEIKTDQGYESGISGDERLFCKKEG